MYNKVDARSRGILLNVVYVTLGASIHAFPADPRIYEIAELPVA